MSSTTRLPETHTATVPPINTNQLPSPSDSTTKNTFLHSPHTPLSPNSQLREPRRSSFNFLRKTSHGKMSKKEREEELLKQQRREATVPKMQTLPVYEPLQPMNSFGGEEARPDSVAIATNQVNSHRARTPSLQTRSMNFSRVSPAAAAPITSAPTGGSPPAVDPYARTESMTHRGRHSYASSAFSTVNGPRRVRRRKDPTPFNILVVGIKNSGKTSFINFLRSSLAQSSKKRGGNSPSPPHTAVAPADSPFTSEYIETEIDNERIGVTLWDSQGLESNLVDLQLREMSAFLESKFEETFLEEQKVVRTPGNRDTHIHCVFLVLDPARLDMNIAAARKHLSAGVRGDPSLRFVEGLDEDLDLQVLRTMQGKTTVIPVISKADTVTGAHMNHLKKMVWFSLKQAKLDPLDALDLDDEEEDEHALDEREEDDYNVDGPINRSSMLNKLSDPSSSDDESDGKSTNPSSPPRPSPDTVRHKRHSSLMGATIASSPSTTDSEVPYLPLSIISPDMYEPGVIGRKFPWGFADPYNDEHCDFNRLKESVLSEWRTELREASRLRWYEGWRTSRLNRKTESRQASISMAAANAKRAGNNASDANIGAARVPSSNVRATTSGGPVGGRSYSAAGGYQAYNPGAALNGGQQRPVTQMT